MAQYEIKFNRPDGWSYAEGEGFASAEEAMKSIGIEGGDKYLCKRMI